MRRSDGSRVFVKASGASSAAGRAAARTQARRERNSLKRLRGLAVPEPVSLSRAELARLTGVRAAALAAQKPLAGVPSGEAGLSKTEIVGVWLFLAEQLAEFKRRGVLYTDIKAENALVSKRPLRVVQIDFDFAARPLRSGRYPCSWFGYTRGFEAPEQLRAATLTEAAVVYQLGMLLGALLTGLKNDRLADPRRGLDAFRRAVARSSSPAVSRLAAACLDPDTARRPRSFAALVRELRAAPATPALRRARAISDKLWKTTKTTRS